MKKIERDEGVAIEALIECHVLWFDKRDGHGIATDANGNEYYIDSSCCPADLKSGEKVFGNVNVRIKDTLCLTNVKRGTR